MEKATFETAVKAAGGKIGLLNKGAYNALQGIVSDGENIVVAGEGIDSKGAGAVIITETHFYGSKFFGMFSSDNVTIPLGKITSFSLTGTAFMQALNITEGTLTHAYPQITNGTAIIEAIKAGQSGSTASAPPPVDTTVELRKFKALLDDGIITQEDFDKKKAALLGL